MKCLHCLEEVINKRSKFCSSKCASDFRYVEYIKLWKIGKVDGKKGKEEVSNYIRRYFVEKYGNKCVKCKWNKINPMTNKVPLTLNHINGNSDDNKEKNLELICPNCHSLTPNFGSLNKGNGRLERRRKARLRYNMGQ